jgi:hypothetical protein
MSYNQKDMSDVTLQNQDSLDYITKVGAEYYFHELKDELEEKEKGNYLVMEVESKEYFLDEDLLKAIEKAEKKFPDKLFFIVQVGTLQPPANFYLGTSDARHA